MKEIYRLERWFDGKRTEDVEYYEETIVSAFEATWSNPRTRTEATCKVKLRMCGYEKEWKKGELVDNTWIYYTLLKHKRKQKLEALDK